jgi:glutamate synthase (NADPH/NADH) small chain
VSAKQLERDYDTVLLTGGAEHPRDLAIEGRGLRGVHFAMSYLPQQNRRVSGEPLGDIEPILATGKQVVVIGGGDTGSDCIGTAFRQGAVSVAQLEIMPTPPEKENKALTWPNWPLKLRTSSSQAEGAARDFSVATSRFLGDNGEVKELECIRLDAKMKPVPGTEFRLPADMVLLAMGFLHPVQEGMVQDLGVELDARGNVKANELDYRTSRPKVFAAGDMRRGQSLVVWAIREGRQAAHAIDKFLMGKTDLPR